MLPVSIGAIVGSTLLFFVLMLSAGSWLLCREMSWISHRSAGPPVFFGRVRLQIDLINDFLFRLR